MPVSVREGLSGARVFSLKAPQPKAIGETLQEKSHLQDSTLEADLDQSSGSLQRHFFQACHLLPCGSGCP